MEQLNYNLFPILVRQVQNFMDADDCQLLIDKALKEEFRPHHSLIGDAESTHSVSGNLLDKKIRSKLQKEISNYAEDIGFDKIKLDNSWFNIQRENSRLLDHSHPLSAVSGAVYLDINEKSSGIRFYNPNPFLLFSPITKMTDYSFGHYWIKPEVGDLIIFPSWLRHGGNDENLHGRRIVLSFNTKIDE